MGRSPRYPVGARHACGLRADGTAVCWGDDYEGQLQALGGTFRTISAGLAHTCGLHPDGTVACWGYNEQGQADALGGQFSAVSAGGFHACGLRTDGTVECWGGRPYASEGVSWPRVDGHPPAGKVVKKVTVLMPPSTDTYLAEWQRGAREQGRGAGLRRDHRREQLRSGRAGPPGPAGAQRRPARHVRVVAGGQRRGRGVVEGHERIRCAGHAGQPAARSRGRRASGTSTQASTTS